MATADHVQRSVAANQVPDEIISEILSPLLKLSDEVFSERSEKVLLDPGYSCSTYLLVCKAWLRVSTPLLYNVVILRTTAQAVALQKALEVSPEIGGFIKKLRVEGGYGAAMHTILKCAPNITDLFISLFIHGTDSTKGLCSGLPLIDPRRVILHDASNPDEKPKKNKQVTQLFETLLVVVTKWKNLKIFDFPYLPAWPQGDVPVSDPRAETLASALVKSKSLEVLIVSVERTFCHEFPGYLRQVVNATALKSLRITGYLRLVDDMRRLVVELKDPRLEALIEWAPFPPPDQGIEILSPSPSPPPGAPDTVEDLPSLKTMGQTSGATLREITVYLNGLQGSSLKSKPVDPNVLVPFTALTKLRWTTWGPYRKLSFANPPRNFSALENLQIMVVRGQSPSLLDISLKLPLNSLQEVDLSESANPQACIAFLRVHGGKLVRLNTLIEVLVEIKVFDLCKSLQTLVVQHPSTSCSPKRKHTPNDFLSCSAPHTALTKINFYTGVTEYEAAIRSNFEQLKAESFPALKEIEYGAVKWPTSEHQVRNNKWIALSEVLRLKGIKLVDHHGVGGTRPGRKL